MENFKKSRARTLLLNNLVEIVMEMAVEGNKSRKEGTKLCMNIIQEEKEKNQKDFLPLLLIECRETYFKREKKLRGFKTVDGTRFTSFMCFLTELYGQLKQQQINDGVESIQFYQGLLLIMLVKCCEACIKLPIKCSCCSVSEAECLFFVLRLIGPDLEKKFPEYLEDLLTCVRDGVLSNASSANLKRTLLQLIELHGSNWQLPDSTKLLSEN